MRRLLLGGGKQELLCYCSRSKIYDVYLENTKEALAMVKTTMAKYSARKHMVGMRAGHSARA